MASVQSVDVATAFLQSDKYLPDSASVPSGQLRYSFASCPPRPAPYTYDIVGADADGQLPDLASVPSGQLRGNTGNDVDGQLPDLASVPSGQLCGNTGNDVDGQLPGSVSVPSDPLLSNMAIYPPKRVQLHGGYYFTTGISHPCYPTRRAREEDDSDSDDGTDSDLDEELEYVAPVPGRALGTRHVPRFDLDKLRPFEVMFVDNKEYEDSKLVAFVLVDVKSNARFKVDVSSKKHNGDALARIVSNHCASWRRHPP